MSETFTTNLRALGECLDLSEKATRNGLRKLERANLVLVIRPPGCNLYITVIPGVPPSSHLSAAPPGVKTATAPFSPEASPDAPPPSSSTGSEAATPAGQMADPRPSPPLDDMHGSPWHPTANLTPNILNQEEP